MASTKTATLEIKVSDASKQRVRTVEDVSQEATAAELVQSLIDDLSLPRNDRMGRSLSYRAMLRREGRHLNAAERVGDVVQDGDWLVMTPNIDAG